MFISVVKLLIDCSCLQILLQYKWIGMVFLWINLSLMLWLLWICLLLLQRIGLLLMLRIIC
jgi:hypothetical protein